MSYNVKCILCEDWYHENPSDVTKEFKKHYVCIHCENEAFDALKKYKDGLHEFIKETKKNENMDLNEN